MRAILYSAGFGEIIRLAVLIIKSLFLQYRSNLSHTSAINLFKNNTHIFEVIISIYKMTAVYDEHIYTVYGQQVFRKDLL